MIATFPVDNKLYRAKIEKVIQENRTCMESEPTFRVRYIDYGNTCDVSRTQLYIWDEVLVIIPAQAVSCKLDTMRIFTKRIQVGSPEAKEFTDLLKQSNPVSIQVRKVLRARDGVFSSDIVHKTPELVVDVFDSQDVNIVEKMKSCAHLGRIIRDKSSSSYAESSFPSKLASSSSRCAPPKPEHLAGEERVEFDLEEAGVSEAGCTESLERVEGWLSGLSGQEILPIDYPQVITLSVYKANNFITLNILGKLLRGVKLNHRTRMV